MKNLSTVTLVGVGLLGGSIGLALRAAGFTGRRIGVGRRRSSLDKALACDAVDQVTLDPADGVAEAQLVVLSTPIGQFEPLLRQIAGALAPGTYVTDVGSTKAQVVRTARRLLPAGVRFVGAHPMAGSEKTGVEFARADLFEEALCLVTPTRATPAEDATAVCHFWQALGGHTVTLSPQQHDKLMARISHLPHVAAAALVRLAGKQNAIDLAGPGFQDTTRIASGNSAMWTDILRSNGKPIQKALDDLIKELTKVRGYLQDEDIRAIEKWLEDGKKTRDGWIAQRLGKSLTGRQQRGQRS
jgi:prephenate dehydrogenase